MTGSVEVVYRGIFQKHLGQRITRGIVLAARKEGKLGISFGRYGDTPERNGIPAKSFAIVADTEEELEGTWPGTSRQERRHRRRRRHALQGRGVLGLVRAPARSTG